MLVLLSFHHPFGFLCFFAFLHACPHVHAWICVSSILQSNGTMDTQSKPTFVPPGHPLLSNNMLVFPFICLACFVYPPFGIFSLFIFSVLFLPFVSLLVCWLVSFVLACTHMEWGCLEEGRDLLGASKKANDTSKRMQAHKGQCSVD